MTRDDIIAEVAKCVSSERNAAYGEPADNFRAIADFWNVYLSSRGAVLVQPLNAADVATMMSLLKIARIATGEAKLDNYVDLAGYAVCGGEVSVHNPTYSV